MDSTTFYVLRRKSDGHYCTGGIGWNWEYRFSPNLKNAKLYSSLNPIKVLMNEAERRNENIRQRNSSGLPSQQDQRPLFDRRDYEVRVVEVRTTEQEVPI